MAAIRARSLDIGLPLAIRFAGTALVINIHETVDAAAGAEVSRRLLQLATSSSIIKFILSAALKRAKLSFCIRVERIQAEVCTEVAKSSPHRISSDFPKAFASITH